MEKEEDKAAEDMQARVQAAEEAVVEMLQKQRADKAASRALALDKRLTRG